MAIVVSADIMKISQLGLHSAAVLLICSLMGCGFQLKGTPGSPDSPSLAGTELVLISSQPRGELTTALREQLRLQGVVVGKKPRRAGSSPGRGTFSTAQPVFNSPSESR